MHGKPVGADPPHPASTPQMYGHSHCAVATAVGTWLGWMQPLSLPRWSIVGAGVLPGLSRPCLGWKKGLAEHGAGKQFEVAGCCWGFIPALADLCSGMCTVERLSFPFACQTPTPAPMGETTEPIFHWAGVILVLCGTPLRSPECCPGMCE